MEYVGDYDAVEVSRDRFHGHGCGDFEYEPGDGLRTMSTNSCMRSYSGSSEAFASSCVYAADGECDEDGTRCHAGTDAVDCAGPSRPEESRDRPSV